MTTAALPVVANESARLPSERVYRDRLCSSEVSLGKPHRSSYGKGETVFLPKFGDKRLDSEVSAKSRDERGSSFTGSKAGSVLPLIDSSSLPGESLQSKRILSPASYRPTFSPHKKSSTTSQPEDDGDGGANTGLLTSGTGKHKAVTPRSESRGENTSGLSFRGIHGGSEEKGLLLNKGSSFRLRGSSRHKSTEIDNNATGALSPSVSVHDGPVGSPCSENIGDTIRSAKEVLRKRVGPMRSSSFYKSSSSGSFRRLNDPSNSRSHDNRSIPSESELPKTGRSAVCVNSGSNTDVTPGKHSKALGTVEELMNSSLSHFGVSGTSTHGGHHPFSQTLEESICDDDDSDADSEEMVRRHQERIHLRLQCLNQQSSTEPRGGLKSLPSDQDPVAPQGSSRGVPIENRSNFTQGSASTSCLALGRKKSSKSSPLHPTFDLGEGAESEFPYPREPDHETGFARFGEDLDSEFGTFQPPSLPDPAEEEGGCGWKGLGGDDNSSDDWYARMRRQQKESDDEGETVDKKEEEGKKIAAITPLELHQTVAPFDQEPSSGNTFSEPHPPSTEKLEEVHARNPILVNN